MSRSSRPSRPFATDILTSHPQQTRSVCFLLSFATPQPLHLTRFPLAASVRSKYASYTAMDKSPSHSNRIRLECTRYYTRRLIPHARRRRQLPAAGASGAGAAGASNVEEEPLDIMAFTTSVENVLSAYLNRNTSVEYHPRLVQLVAPVSARSPLASFLRRLADLSLSSSSSGLSKPKLGCISALSVSCPSTVRLCSYLSTSLLLLLTRLPDRGLHRDPPSLGPNVLLSVPLPTVSPRPAYLL